MSALYAQRRALDVTGQNIANANTEGYSRQRIVMSALGGPSSASVYAVGDPAGQGVVVSDLTRFHDEYLEARGRAEHASNAYLADKKTIYTSVEQVIGEPSDTGIQSQLSAFWSAWHDVANEPGDAAVRTQLLEKTITLTDSLRNARTGVASLWDSTRQQLTAYVTEVNTAADTVAQLNDSVRRAQQAGLPGNELADQRDVAVMHLVELTGASTRTVDDGSVTVSIEGSSLVSGSHTRHLQIVGATRMVDQASDPVGLAWVDTGAGATASAGKLAADLEALGTTLPGIAGQIDNVATTLMNTVNDQHMLGYDLNGDPGGAFFIGTDASDIQVAITDPRLVAAAGPPIPPATSSLDGSNADAMADLAKTAGGADTAYRQFVVDLGVAAQTAYSRAKIQDSITQDVDASRISASGVNLDEEAAAMLMYQRAYQAAAKVMAVIDETLASLINGIR